MKDVNKNIERTEGFVIKSRSPKKKNTFKEDEIMARTLHYTTLMEVFVSEVINGSGFLPQDAINNYVNGTLYNALASVMMGNKRCVESLFKYYDKYGCGSNKNEILILLLKLVKKFTPDKFTDLNLSEHVVITEKIKSNIEKIIKIVDEAPQDVYALDISNTEDILKAQIKKLQEIILEDGKSIVKCFPPLKPNKYGGYFYIETPNKYTSEDYDEKSCNKNIATIKNTSKKQSDKNINKEKSGDNNISPKNNEENSLVQVIPESEGHKEQEVSLSGQDHPVRDYEGSSSCRGCLIY